MTADYINIERKSMLNHNKWNGINKLLTISWNKKEKTILAQLARFVAVTYDRMPVYNTHRRSICWEWEHQLNRSKNAQLLFSHTLNAREKTIKWKKPMKKKKKEERRYPWALRIRIAFMCFSWTAKYNKNNFIYQMQRIIIIIIYWSWCLSCTRVYVHGYYIGGDVRPVKKAAFRPFNCPRETPTTSHVRNTLTVNSNIERSPLGSPALPSSMCRSRCTAERRKRKKKTRCEKVQEETMQKRWAKRWMRCDREWRQRTIDSTHNWNGELHEYAFTIQNETTYR